MFRKLILAILIVAMFLTAPGSIAEDEPEHVMDFIAVLDLRCKGVNKEVCSILTDIIIEEMVKIGQYTVIDRANRDNILAEQGFQQTGCVDESCVVEAGRMLGVGKIVSGSLSKLGETYIISLQLINVQTGAVEAAARETCKCELDGLINTAANVTRKLMGQAPIPTPSRGTSQPTGARPGEMIQVPAGEFWMGCNSAVDSACDDDEKPYHKVYLDAFYIDKYEVTVDQYAACVRAGKCKEPSRGSGKWAKYYNWGKSGRGNHPINGVGWHDAKSYCEYVGKRLPTEAEWEKAARGTDGRKYLWGNQSPGSGRYGNFADESARQVFPDWTIVNGYDDGYVGTVPVGSFPQGSRPYGAMDMAGNVWEWVADWYDKNYYNNTLNRNLKGPSSGSSRVRRGGSWSGNPSYLRTSCRSGREPSTRSSRLGFRCARTP